MLHLPVEGVVAGLEVVGGWETLKTKLGGWGEDILNGWPECTMGIWFRGVCSVDYTWSLVIA